MGGLTETEKKEKIDKKLKVSYDKYKDNCQTRLELDRKINGELSTDEKEFLETEKINLYYIQQKNKYLDEFSDLKEKKYKEENDKLREQFFKNMMDQQNKLQKEHEEALRNMEEKARKEEEQRQKERNEAIQNLMNEHNRNIEAMRRDALEQQRKFDEQRKKDEKKSHELLEKIEKRFKEERDEEKRKQILEEKRKLEEQNKKKEELQKAFDETVKGIKEEKIKEIINSFSQEEDKFCMEEISKFDQKKINKLIFNLFKNENVLRNILYNLNIYIEKVKSKIRNVEHLNIILVGPCGVGKSTLINAILELETKTLTGFGKPQTQSIDFFSSDTIPFLRLADSKGIEKNESSGVTATYNAIKDFIQKQLSTNDPDKYIHCIWYCWTGARLEESEIEILKKLSLEYTLDNLPVIIVYTNAIDKLLVEQAKKYIKNELHLTNEFVEVLALEKLLIAGVTIPPYNLDKLRDISIKLAMQAVNSSCYQGLAEEIKTIVRDTIKNLTDELNTKMDSEVRNIISKLNEESKFEELYEQNKNIILDIFYKFIFLDPDIQIENYQKPEVVFGNNKYIISKKSQNLIKDFVIDYFQQNLKDFDKNLDNMLINYTKELCNEIITFQMEFNQKNDYLFKTPWTSIELEKIIKKYLHDNLSKRTKLANLKNSFRYITKPIIEIFGEYFKTSYNKGMTKEEYINNARKAIQNPFQSIQKQIEEYNEKLKKKKVEENVQDMAPTPVGVNQSVNTPTIEDDLNQLSW